MTTKTAHARHASRDYLLFCTIEPEQLRFLIAFSHRLTVAARDTYEFQSSGVTDPKRLRALNEVQHRVSGHAMALLRADPYRYPDDVLIRIFLDEKSESERAGIAWAFDNARETLHRDD
jgi:hypothetical protein